MVWYGLIVCHTEYALIKAFVEKHGLVVDDQSMALKSIALCCSVDSQASHSGVNQKRERTAGRTCVSF